jgi:hypothetical protein
MEVSGQFHVPSTLPPGERTAANHWIGGWVGTTAIMDTMEKRKISFPCWESNPSGSYPYMYKEGYFHEHGNLNVSLEWVRKLNNLLLL